MPFSDVRNSMRDNQAILHGTKYLNVEVECEQHDIISRKQEEPKISQIKLKHLNKVAPTASPYLPKTPNRVIILLYFFQAKVAMVIIGFCPIFLQYIIHCLPF